MTKCPSCFQVLDDNMFVWVCQTGRCDQTHDAEASRFAGVSISNGNKYHEVRPERATKQWHHRQSVDCASCNEPAAEACPNCFYALLPGWRSAETTCVAMNGARSTGKSLYIAVAIKALMQFAVNNGNTVAFANTRTAEVYSKVYEAPLFAERGIMAPTPRSNTDNSYQREPLIFSLGMVRGVRRYLVIRDVAGEEMEHPPEQTSHLQFLAHADAVLFMFDPLAVPDVRAKLVDLVPAQLRSGGDPSVVLNNFLNLVDSKTPRLGVILSKFDALQELRNVEDLKWRSIMSNAGAAFSREPNADATGYDHIDGELLHEEVKSLLFELNGGAVVLNLENPQNGQKVPYRFFAVSALGESPDGLQLHSRGIASFRVLDPLLWVLDATGAL